MPDTDPMSLVDSGRRPLGRSSCGPLAFGCWRFTHSDPSRGIELVETALDLGIDLVDTADVYGLDWGGAGFGACEEALGRVLAARPDLRDRMVLATKGGIVPGVPYDSGPGALRRACEASLRRLGVDHVDLYQVHRPDLFAHPAQVAEDLAALVDAGLTREIGVSNHTVGQTTALAAHLRVPLASTQPELSLVHLAPLRDGTLDHCLAAGLTPLAWSPLGGGALASGEGVRAELLEELDRLAAREGVDRTTIALAFVLAHPSRPVAILGTQRPERLHQAAAATSVCLDRTDVYALLQAAEGVPLP